jgi:carboxypeptidase C (cathepsin A)
VSNMARESDQGMLKRVGKWVLAIATIGLTGAPAVSQETPPGTVASPSASTWPRVTQMADLGPRQYSVVHRGTFGGHKMQYLAALSELLVKDRTGKPASSVFVTSFVANPVPTASAVRPVIFIFNGGPGGASNTLMFGALGTERLQRFDVAAQADPTTAVVANEDTILDIADLAFIDAPETGFGRPLPGSDPKTFRSNDGDAFAFTQVILRWLTDHRRLSAPVYLAGESYGSIRAVLLARDLSVATPRAQLAGLVLISQALNYNGPESFSVKRLPDPVRAISRLPDIAALSWYHGLIDNQSQTLEQAVRSAQAFALSDYAQALIAGNRLLDEDRAHVAGRLAALTGLSAEYWSANGLRLDNLRRQLLAGRNLALAQFDGRETEPLAGVPDDENRDYQVAERGLTAATDRFASRTFQAKGLPDYRTIVTDPYGFEKTWQYIAPPAPGADVVLREQMSAEPQLRLFVAQGIFDTTCWAGETDYLFSQLGTPQSRTTFARYVGGHILYSDDAGRRAFLNDVRAFVSGQPLPTRDFPKTTPLRKFAPVN